jgi:3-oxoacyl-[acyl-carrier protein] reductase
MKSAGAGAIVNVLSQVTAGAPPMRMADYVSAKYALYGLSKSLAAEWAGDNIRVNMVSPGLIETDLTQHYAERIFKMEASRTPLKRIARPEDVAGAVAYLLSDEAAFITGTNLFVTGGQVMV